MSFLRPLHLPLVSSLLLASLCWGTPVLAQPTLSEQLQTAVEAGQWQQAIDLIDQTIAADPARQESLLSFRERYSQRLTIEQQLSQGNWRQASALLDQFVTAYPEDGQALREYQTQLQNLAELQTLVDQGDRIGALDKARSLQASSPDLADLMRQYEQRIISGIPQVGQSVATPSYTATVTQFQDVTRQVDPEAEQRQYLVRVTVQNTGAEPLTLASGRQGGFSLFVQEDRQFNIGRDATSVLEDQRLEPLSTTLAPGEVLQGGVVYGLDDLPQPLYLRLDAGRLVRLR